MNVNLKQYSWLFFKRYVLLFLVNLVAVSFANYYLGSSVPSELMAAIAAMSGSVFVADKFIKNEGRFFNEIEKKRLIKKMVLIALGTSLLPEIIVFGYFIIIKLIVSEQDFSALLYKTQAEGWLRDFILMKNEEIFVVLLISNVIYYFILGYFIKKGIKRVETQYNTNLQKIKS